MPHLVLWRYGLLVDKGSEADSVPVNDADHWSPPGPRLRAVASAWEDDRGAGRA